MEFKAKILIVEDESIVAMELRDRLQRMNFTVVGIYDSGDTAIAKARETMPDLVLMDIIIKGNKDGIETAHLIHSQLDIPIIFLTAHSDPKTLERAQKEAPYGYILKPFRERELQITIDMALERHKMEQQVKESERWLHTTLNSIGDAVIATDEKGVIKFLNPVAQKYTGWLQQEAVGKNFSQVFNIVNEETRAAQENPVDKALRTKSIVHLANHTVLISKTGKELCIEDSAAPILNDNGQIKGVVVVFYDVSERKKMQRQLKESEEKYRSFIEHFNGIAFQLNSDYTPIFINGAVESITGYPAEDFMNGTVNWKQLIHPDDLKMIKAINLAQKQNHNKTEFEHEYRIICKDGSQRWVHSLMQKIFSSSGKLIRLQGVVYDVSDKKIMEAELIRSQKLESLGVLAGGIAHDFNNLLTAIFGNIGLAKLYIRPEEKSFQRLDEAEKALVRAKDLTQQLLVFSKGGAPILQTIDVRDVIKSSATFALRGSNVNFVFEANSDLWSVDFDEGQLSQIIQNLVINADHAMPDGGTVSIHCKNVVLKQNDHTLPDGNYVRIVVADEGMGIDPQNINYIFDPYFTTKEHGSGLGLATIYSIIKNHNAHISVDSVVGKGTSFEILIPASTKGLNESANKDELETLEGSGRILVMDDQDIILDFAEHALTQFGYQVDCCTTGEEAIRKYKEALNTDNPYDLLLMDLTVPGGMGGKEAMKELVKIDPQVKAIVSSGYSGNPVMSEYKKYGFKAVLKKPFKVKELVSAVKYNI